MQEDEGVREKGKGGLGLGRKKRKCQEGGVRLPGREKGKGRKG